MHRQRCITFRTISTARHPFRNHRRRKFPESVTNVLKISETSPQPLCSPLRRRTSPINIETISGSRARFHRASATAAFRGSQPGCTELSRLLRAPSPCVQALIFRDRRRILDRLPGTAESDFSRMSTHAWHPLAHFRSVPERRSSAPLLASTRRLWRHHDPVRPIPARQHRLRFRHRHRCARRQRCLF